MSLRNPKLWLLLCIAVVVSGSVIYFMYNHQFQPPKKARHKLSGAAKQMNSLWWTRAYPDPYYINGKYLAAWEKAREMKTNALTRMSGVAESGLWKPIGPTTLGGRILSIAVNPKKHSTVVAGSASGGIWKSYTGGVGLNAWQPIETGFPVLGVTSILINPVDTNIIYVATGEVYRADTANLGFNVWKARGTYGVGILRSSDGGDTWAQVFMKDLKQLIGIQKIRFDPTNYNTVYACCTDGLWRTTDGGGSWTKILDKIYVADVQINSANNSQIVVSVGNLMNADKGVYRTTNGNSATPTWNKVASGLPSKFQGFISFDRHEGSNILYASIGVAEGETTELYRSADFGATWLGLSGTGHAQWQYWFAHAAAVDPNNSNKVTYGGIHPYQVEISFNAQNGNLKNVSVSSIADPNANPTMNTYLAPGDLEGGSRYVHVDIHDIEYVPGSSDSVYICSDGGIFLSTNANAANLTFKSCNSGLQTAQFYGPVGQSQSDANFFLGGLQDNNTAVYDGTTGRWKRVIGGDGGPSAIKPDNDNIVLSSRDARAVYRSTNKTGGYSQVAMYWGSNADSRTGFMAPLAWSKFNTNVVYLGSDNLHKSTDAGASWSGDSYTSATKYIEAQHKTAVALAVSPTNADKVYVSTSPFAQYDNEYDKIHVNPPPNFLKSVDGGNSFVSIKSSLPDRFVMDIAIHPTNDNVVWVVMGGFGSGHVYRTMDGGATWTNLDNGNLPDVPTTAIMVDPNNTNILYVGNDLGVYVTADGGSNWIDFSGGLWDATMIADLVPVPGGKIRAATHGKGVFEALLFNPSTLPVTITSFKGNVEGSNNILKWFTSEELDLQHYELERSLNGWQFERVVTIPAKNLSSAEYLYSDRVQNYSSYYYRLKAVNNNNSFKYSEVILLRRIGKEELKIVGNPFVDALRLNIVVAQKGKLRVNLYNSLGQLVRFKEATLDIGPANSAIESLGDLPKGVYTVEAIFNQRRWLQKIIKN